MLHPSRAAVQESYINEGLDLIQTLSKKILSIYIKTVCCGGGGGGQPL